MSKENRLYVHLVLDSSGSMLRNQAVTLKACNDYIVALEPGTVVTVDRFSTKPHRLREAVPKERACIAPDEYPCDGGTALYDAIGHAVNDINTRAGSFDRIALVIQTDGQETSSTEFTREAIKQVLTDKQEGEGWLVVWLGAGIDAFRQFAAMGAMPQHSAVYDVANSAQAFGSLNRATMAYNNAGTRFTGREAASFTVDERKSMKPKT